MAKPSASQVANSLSGGSLSELRRRIVFLLLALLVFRTGTFIPVPGIDLNVMSEIFDQQRTGILGMFNMFSGGALERMSIFALGVMPYIS
ncbi:MAG: preprotein translocase subunit SecY, partial [Gammaproteobacteria bacterium]|nr:preprotein translocase subunit SecY [Gammaproteobacteria bacterium]